MSPEHGFRSLVLRLMLCLATAAIISVTAYLCAWFSYRDYDYFRIEAYMTRKYLELLGDDIARHKEKTGSLPATLADLDVVKEQRVSVDETGCPVDFWRRPFNYRVEGN